MSFPCPLRPEDPVRRSDLEMREQLMRYGSVVTSGRLQERGLRKENSVVYDSIYID